MSATCTEFHHGQHMAAICTSARGALLSRMSPNAVTSRVPWHGHRVHPPLQRNRTHHGCKLPPSRYALVIPGLQCISASMPLPLILTYTRIGISARTLPLNGLRVVITSAACTPQSHQRLIHAVKLQPRLLLQNLGNSGLQTALRIGPSRLSSWRHRRPSRSLC